MKISMSIFRRLRLKRGMISALKNIRGPLESIVLLSCLFSVGCSTVTPYNSYVDPHTPSMDMGILAKSMTSFIAKQYPPASSTLVLYPPVDTEDQLNNALTPVLTRDLKVAGFAISDLRQKIAGSHTIRYWVTPMDMGLLVRLKLDNTEASRWYQRNRMGILETSEPFTVRR
jgi:hypothetical protein